MIGLEHIQIKKTRSAVRESGNVYEKDLERCLMCQNVLLVYQRDEPLDVFIRHVGYFAFVVYRQQGNLNGFVLMLNDIESDDMGTITFTLALRSDGHTHFADTISQIIALKWILSQFFFKAVIIIEQRRILLGKTFELAKEFVRQNKSNFHEIPSAFSSSKNSSSVIIL